MTGRQMTPAQLQTAYRLAVQASLITFYGKASNEAKRLVDSWWQRMSPVSDIQSGMYLHSEALATAADLAHTQEVQLTDATRQRYRRILHESTRIACDPDRKMAKSTKRVELKQMAG
jgi:hypothetical protein